MEPQELHDKIRECNVSPRYYQRLIAMKLISIGFSFSKVGRILLVSYLSIHRWAKACETSGLSGLIPEFGGGRPPKLSKNMENKLSKRIEREEKITMVEVQNILKNEYNVEFTLPHICNIVRKLGFDYIQPKNDNDEFTLRKVVVKTN